MDPDPRPVPGATPRIVVAVAHPAMRAMIGELLDHHQEPWSVIAVDPSQLPAVLAEQPVDLVVVDGADFPACCRQQLSNLPLDHVVVIGAEPDAAYQAAALHHGAGGWLPRDRVGEDLLMALHQALTRSRPHAAGLRTA